MAMPSVAEIGEDIISSVNIGVAQENPLCRAPKKTTLRLCRVQRPVPGALQDALKIEKGSLGYVFRYTTGELLLYQLKEGETFSSNTITAIVTSNDWSVLRAVIADYLKELFERMGSEEAEDSSEDESEEESEEEGEGEEEAEDDPGDKKNGNGGDADGYQSLASAMGVFDMEASEPKILKFVWETGASSTDHWYYRVCIHTPGGVNSKLVVERFNTACGVFQQVIVMTCKEWVEMFDKWGDRIALLFRMSQDYKELIIVRKALFP